MGRHPLKTTRNSSAARCSPRSGAFIDALEPRRLLAIVTPIKTFGEEYPYGGQMIANVTDIGGGVALFAVISRKDFAQTLWRTDGTSDGTIPLATLGVGFSKIAPLPDGGAIVLYKNNRWSAGGGGDVWRTDGSESGTVLLKHVEGSITIDGYGNIPYAFVGDSLLFSADDRSSGSELWKTDGTPQGTVLVKDINAGPSSAFDTTISFTAFGDSVYFGAISADGGVRHLWKSDGFDAGTVQFSDMEIFRVFTSAPQRGLFFGAPSDDGEFATRV